MCHVSFTSSTQFRIVQQTGQLAPKMPIFSQNLQTVRFKGDSAINKIASSGGFGPLNRSFPQKRSPLYTSLPVYSILRSWCLFRDIQIIHQKVLSTQVLVRVIINNSVIQKN